MKYLYLFVIVTLLASEVLGQATDMRFKHLTNEQGLSHNAVFCVLKDSRGFMWFGTGNGLNRYDGYTFVTYQNDPKNANSLRNNHVNSLYEDHSGIFWIGTDDGVDQFDPVTGEFKHLLKDTNQGTGTHINCIYGDHFGVVWIGSSGGGLISFDPTTSQFTYYKHNPSDPHTLGSNSVLCVLEDRAGQLWVGTFRGGLNRFDRKTGTFVQYKNNPEDTTSLANNSVYALFEDHQRVFWVGTARGAHQMNRNNGQFVHYANNPDDPHGLNDNGVSSIAEDASGEIWIGTPKGGLNKFERHTGHFVHYMHQPNNPNSLGDNSIEKIYKDASGTLWIATTFGGISFFNRFTNQFTNYQNQPNVPGSLSNNVVMPIYEDRAGTLWIGTYGGGLDKFDSATGQFSHNFGDPKNRKGLTSNLVYAIYEDKSGVFWVGTNGGLNQFDRNTGEVRHYVNDPNDSTSLSNNAVCIIYEDQYGNFWVGTFGGGLNRLDRKTGKFARYEQHATLSSDSLNSDIIPVLYEDCSGTFWVGTFGAGLSRLDRTTGQFTWYYHQPEDSTSLSDNGIWAICEDHHGNLWVGTGKGLNKFDRKQQTFSYYQEGEGLCDNEIYGVLEDNQGKLWISTNKGLSSFDPKTEIFKNYDANDGLPSNEFSMGSHLKTSSGKMIFGGVNGLTIFHPDSLRDNPHVPPVVLTDFQIFNQSVPVRQNGPLKEDDYALPKSIDAVEEITLPYKANVFSFEFAALDYVQPEKNQYAYRMEGFDQDWNRVGNKRTATYTNLDPGAYVFRVQGSNNDGVWNRQGKTLRITISPPWWRTWWAYAVYVLLLGAALYALWRYGVARERLKHDLRFQQLAAQQLQEVDRIKTRFFTNISHEFRTPLTLILGPLEQLLAQPTGTSASNHQQYGLMHRQGQRLLRLINELLEISRLEAGSTPLQAQEEYLAPLLRWLVSSFDSLAEIKHIQLQFHTDEDSLRVYVDRDKLEKIIHNLLGNALKFTPEGGHISVTLAKRKATSEGVVLPTQSAAEIRIKDTGAGISQDQIEHIFDRFYRTDEALRPDREGTGIGLSLVKELVTLHRGQIEVQSEEGHGTEFVMQLPLGRSHLRDEEIMSPSVTFLSPSPTLVRERVEEEPSPTPILAPDQDHAPTQSLMLIVEDSADVRHYIRDIFADTYRVEEAKDGSEGLIKALESIPDLIISDLMMPGMDGLALCQRLKTDERTSHIPIVLLTAKATVENRVEGLESGADDYLTKPFYPFELRTRVKNLLDIRKKLQQRYRRELVLQPGQITVTSMDERFLQRAKQTVERYLSDSTFNVEVFSQEMATSRVQLYRKLKALTEQSPGDFIRVFRLQRAAQLLEQNGGNVAEIAYEVGFDNLSYFTQCFRQQYGCTPSKYRAEKLI